MIPEKFIVTAEGKFKPGLAVLLRFKMSEKNNYYYFVFLDDKGQAVVGIDELLKSFDQDRNFFLMDYSNPRFVFTGQVEAHVETTEEIEGAIREREKYKGHFNYPPNYLENLKKALSANAESNCTVKISQSH